VAATVAGILSPGGFAVNIWYDTLFGTFAFQSPPAAAQPRIAGTNARPGQVTVTFA
jgi:hypothetical protein